MEDFILGLMLSPEVYDSSGIYEVWSVSLLFQTCLSKYPTPIHHGCTSSHLITEDKHMVGPGHY